MAARIYGSPGDEPGDDLVYESLRALPGDCIIYAQPVLVYRRNQRNPDYVIVSERWGVIVLEVKDWTDIIEADAGHAYRPDQSTGQLKQATSPVEQARRAAHILSSLLKEDDSLVSYAGGLDFPYTFAGVLPFLPSSSIRWLEKKWGQDRLLGRDDILKDRIADKIANIPREFTCLMMEEQMRAVCAILDETLKCRDHRTGAFKGVYSREQEALAKEPIEVKARPAVSLESVAAGPVQMSLGAQDGTERDPENQVVGGEPAEQGTEADATTATQDEGVTPEMVELAEAMSVRLVRGFAGTGKTDILIMRARWLHKQWPDLRILVTTFNDPLYKKRLKPELGDLKPHVDVEKFDTLCAEVYKARNHGSWVNPQDTLGLIKHMQESMPLIKEFGSEFLADGFIWMKETQRTTRSAYMESTRQGRGGPSGARLSRTQKGQVFDLFEAYNEELKELPGHDWVDLHDKALRYLQDGVRPRPPYDYILIDEGQHFAPTWMRIIKAFLKPGGSVFMCDDPSQSVYRYYSWRQKGVSVVGRTRWLKVPYRNTRQIFTAAYALIENDALAMQLLMEEGEDPLPNLDITRMRNGDLPLVRSFDAWDKEREFVSREIDALARSGVPLSQIAILHEKPYALQRYRTAVPAGVVVDEVKKQTGMEYYAVFIPKAQDLLDQSVSGGLAQYESKQRLKLYMAMCRARTRVYMLYQKRWPREFDALRPHVNWVEPLVG